MAVDWAGGVGRTAATEATAVASNSGWKSRGRWGAMQGGGNGQEKKGGITARTGIWNGGWSGGKSGGYGKIRWGLWFGGWVGGGGGGSGPRAAGGSDNRKV